MKRLIILLMILALPASLWGVTFTQVTPGASDTTKVMTSTIVATIETSDLVDGAVTPAKTDGTFMQTDGSNASAAATVRAALGVYSIDEVDKINRQNTIQYFFTEIATGAYELFANLPPVAQASDPITLGTTGYALVDAWVTPYGEPRITVIPAGQYTASIWLSKSGSTASYFKAEWYSRTPAGVETFIASSSEKLITGTLALPTEQLLHFNPSVQAIIGINDMLVIKLYSYRSAGVAAGCSLWYGNGTSGSFGAPISTSRYMRVDGGNASTTASLAIKDITLSDKVKAAWAEITGNIYASGTLNIDGASVLMGEVKIATSTDAGAFALQVAGNIIFSVASDKTIRFLAPSSIPEIRSVDASNATYTPLRLAASQVDLVIEGTSKWQVIPAGATQIEKTGFGAFYTVTRSSVLSMDAAAITPFADLATVSAGLPCGILNVWQVTDSKSSVMSIANGAVTELTGGAGTEITNTKGSANAINVYVETGILYVQNTNAVLKSVRVSFQGANGIP